MADALMFAFDRRDKSSGPSASDSHPLTPDGDLMRPVALRGGLTSSDAPIHHGVMAAPLGLISLAVAAVRSSNREDQP